MSEKVLVLCATGKVGRNVCIALKSRGFTVYGTTRNTKKNIAEGVIPVECNYVDRKSLDAAFVSTGYSFPEWFTFLKIFMTRYALIGAKKAFIITDYFLAARSSQAREVEQGKMMVDACKKAGCEFVVYSSACDPEFMSDKVLHVKGKSELVLHAIY
jgi:nucleoside-diphosphate-sugar epimerase